MAYKTQIERLAVVENEIKTVKETVSEVKSSVQEVRDHQSSNHVHITGLLNELKDSVQSRLDGHEQRIKIIEETVDPLTRFRNKVWGLIITTALTCAIVAIILIELKRFK